jgi:hypothetical protein
MLMGIIRVAVTDRIIKMWALEGNLLPIPFRLLFPPPSSAPPLLPHHCPLSLSISYPNLLSYYNLPLYKTITRRFRIRIIRLHIIISHHIMLNLKQGRYNPTQNLSNAWTCFFIQKRKKAIGICAFDFNFEFK